MPGHDYVKSGRLAVTDKTKPIYRSFSVIRHMFFPEKSVLGWQVSAKIGVRLIAKYFRVTKS